MTSDATIFGREQLERFAGRPTQPAQFAIWAGYADAPEHPECLHLLDELAEIGIRRGLHAGGPRAEIADAAGGSAVARTDCRDHRRPLCRAQHNLQLASKHRLAACLAARFRLTGGHDGPARAPRLQRHCTRSPESNAKGSTMSDKAAHSARKIETRKKKARRVIPRAKVTRIQGNTAAVRRRLKKMSGIARQARAKAAAAA